LKNNHRMTRKHYKNLVFSCYLAYIRTKHPAVPLQSIVEGLGIDYNYLKDTSQYSSVEFDYYFIKACIEATGDPNLAYNAGLLIYSRVSCGHILSTIVHKASDFDYIYKVIPRAMAFFNDLIIITYKDCSSEDNKFFRIEPIYKNLGDDPNDINFFKMNLPNIYRNIIAHICSIKAMRANDKSETSKHVIMQENEDYCDIVVMLNSEDTPDIKPIEDDKMNELARKIFKTHAA
jgi:hypothetical protein